MHDPHPSSTLDTLHTVTTTPLLLVPSPKSERGQFAPYRPTLSPQSPGTVSDGALLDVASVSESQAGWLTWKLGVPSDEDTCALRGDDMRAHIRMCGGAIQLGTRLPQQYPTSTMKSSSPEDPGAVDPQLGCPRSDTVVLNTQKLTLALPLALRSTLDRAAACIVLPPPIRPRPR
ncbi:hypothetical protein CVT26_012900 [Gymnopilus dilepis]|uniref:Uncharacterized protein n=1 Tax=Gymnopilus dilepis TaxID=231916 RepID=A0A409WD74_9AGAR|nr:hypothetical protein CVT26_012900 [Gymnopilus dilepis]